LIGFVVFEIHAIVRVSIFGCILMENAYLVVAHALYHVIRMWGVKSNPIFGFRVPKLEIGEACQIHKLSIKQNYVYTIIR